MRSILKAGLNGLATLMIVPALLLYRASKVAFGPDRAFPGWSQAFSLIPGLSGTYLRRAFYRHVFPRCAADASASAWQRRLPAIPDDSASCRDG